MQLRMTDSRQAAVKFPCASDNTSSSVKDTLQPVRHSLWGYGQHGVAIVNARRHEGMHERRG